MTRPGIVARSEHESSKERRVEVLDLSLGPLPSKIRVKQISPVEVTQELLARIDPAHDEMNAYITVLHEEAFPVARRRGVSLGYRNVDIVKVETRRQLLRGTEPLDERKDFDKVGRH